MHYGILCILMAAPVMMVGALGGFAETGRPPSDTLAKAMQAVENLDTLRSGLAGTFEGSGIQSLSGLRVAVSVSLAGV